MASLNFNLMTGRPPFNSVLSQQYKQAQLIILGAILVLVNLSCHNYSLMEHLENPSGITGKSSCQGKACRIYITSNSFNGGITLSGADAACNNDSAKPNNNRYKAMLGNGSIRRVCTAPFCSTSTGMENAVDWVLYPNQAYVRADGVTSIGVTNGYGFFDTIPSDGIGGAAYNNSFSWTGLTNSWESDSSNCNSWQDGTSYYMGAYGAPGSPTTSIYSSGDYCGSGRHLYCVEQ